MVNVKVEYSRTAQISLQDIANNLKWRQLEPKKIINEMLNEFERKVTTFPEGYPVSPQLLKLGVNRYRECNTANGYRIFYTYNDGTVTTHLILAQRQDIHQLLFKRLIES